MIVLFIVKPRHQIVFGINGNWTLDILLNYKNF